MSNPLQSVAMVTVRKVDKSAVLLGGTGITSLGIGAVGCTVAAALLSRTVAAALSVRAGASSGGVVRGVVGTVAGCGRVTTGGP